MKKFFERLFADEKTKRLIFERDKALADLEEMTSNFNHALAHLQAMSDTVQTMIAAFETMRVKNEQLSIQLGQKTSGGFFQ